MLLTPILCLVAESRAQSLSKGCQAVSSVVTEDGARTAVAVGTLDRTLSAAATTVARFLASGLEREHTLEAPSRSQYHLPTMVPATKPYADILAEFAREWQEESTLWGQWLLLFAAQGAQVGGEQALGSPSMFICDCQVGTPHCSPCAPSCTRSYS